MPRPTKQAQRQIIETPPDARRRITPDLFDLFDDPARETLAGPWAAYDDDSEDD